MKTLSPPAINPERAYFNIFEEADYVLPSELHYHELLSARFNADVYLLSELNQRSGSYKLRGAFNWFSEHQSSGITEVVAFSAGNHGSGVAACANMHGVGAKIFMPEDTPLCKVDLVRSLGGAGVKPVLVGKNVDEAAIAGSRYLESAPGSVGFVHPFDDPSVVAGQGTLGIELERTLPDTDVIVAPVGGGGLLSGIIHATHENTGAVYVAAEPAGAPSLINNLKNPCGMLSEIDTFVDGASVKKVGRTILNTLAEIRGRYTVVPVTNHALRQSVTELWNESHGLKPELAGALSVAALEDVKEMIMDKTVVCVVSGGNLSADRFEREVRLR